MLHLSLSILERPIGGVKSVVWGFDEGPRQAHSVRAWFHREASPVRLVNFADLLDLPFSDDRITPVNNPLRWFVCSWTARRTAGRWVLRTPTEHLKCVCDCKRFARLSIHHFTFYASQMKQTPTFLYDKLVCFETQVKLKETIRNLSKRSIIAALHAIVQVTGALRSSSDQASSHSQAWIKGDSSAGNPNGTRSLGPERTTSCTGTDT
jgi:hypothetical protein